jgi:hypothetical protein
MIMRRRSRTPATAHSRRGLRSASRSPPPMQMGMHSRGSPPACRRVSS